MRRSCLVGLILVAAILLAASFALQRYIVRPEPGAPEAAAPTPLSAAPEAQPATALPTLQAPAAVLAENRVYEARIEGLYLETVQPLFEIPIQVRGLAAVDGALYATVSDPAAQTAWLHEIDRSTYKVVRSFPLHEQGTGEPCGLQAAGQILWTCLSTENSALILAVDRAAWNISTRSPFTDTLRAIVQLADGSLVGMGGGGRWYHQWGADGALLRSTPNASGVAYGDCEVIRGSLLCAGADESGGVLDVIDPASLSLLSRHRASTRTLWGAWVAGNALAFDGERFLLAPLGGDLPLLWTYRLGGGALADFVPSTRPPQ